VPPNPVVRHVIDGWQLSGIAQFVSGTPGAISFSTVDSVDLTVAEMASASISSAMQTRGLRPSIVGSTLPRSRVPARTIQVMPASSMFGIRV
jgi:hypothetical protein